MTYNYGYTNLVTRRAMFDLISMAAKPTTPQTLASDPAAVDAWMAASTHPLKAELQALREIILSSDKGAGEHIKWNHPAFFYTGPMAPFAAKEYKRYIIVSNVHSAGGGVLLVVWRGDLIADPTGLLSGDYADGRRLARFHGMAEVTAGKKALKAIVKQMIARLKE